MRTRNILLAISALEVLAVVTRRDWARAALFGSGALGLAALVCVVETGERGGEIVYAHAGGVGTRSGDPADVERLLLAGLYHQAELDERAGRADDAAALIEMAARRFPSEPAVQVMAAQSLLEHRHDPAAALALLRTVAVAADDPQLRFRHGWLLPTLWSTGSDGHGPDHPATTAHQFPDGCAIAQRSTRTANASNTTGMEESAMGIHWTELLIIGRRLAILDPAPPRDGGAINKPYREFKSLREVAESSTTEIATSAQATPGTGTRRRIAL
jgi:hypothetical protein